MTQTKKVQNENSGAPGTTAQTKERDRTKQNELNRLVKEGKWQSAKKLIGEVGKELQAEIASFDPQALTKELNQDIKSFVRALDYHDLLRKKDYDWLDKYLRKAYKYSTEETSLEELQGDDERAMWLLHSAMSHILFEFRREKADPESFYAKIEKVAEIAQKTVSEIKEETSAEKIVSGVNADTASFWSRLNYIRYMTETRRQDLIKAEKFLKLAGKFCDMQAKFEAEKIRIKTVEFLNLAVKFRTSRSSSDSKKLSEKADEINLAHVRVKEILYVKSINIGIGEVFLQISAGRYEAALNLLKPITFAVGEEDPRTAKEDPKAELEAAIAETTCRRCLNADREEELKELYNYVEKKKNYFDKDFSETFRHYRLFLRLYYEQSLIVLLLINLEKDEAGRLAQRRRLKRHIAVMNKMLAEAGGRENDPVWKAQINTLEARSELHEGNFQLAEEKAEKALEAIKQTNLELLKIEAHIAKAVVLLRRGGQENYGKAITLLKEALKLNKEKHLTSPFPTVPSEYSQPALSGLAYLYLARIFIRLQDRFNALKYLEQYRHVKRKIEHRWVTHTLAPQLEQEIRFELLTGSRENGQYNLDFQTKLLRKHAIETASEALKTDRIAAIAEKLGVSAQTLYIWIRELESDNLEPELVRTSSTSAEAKGDYREQLIRGKEEIEEASRILDTDKKARIAKYLNISRQTLYNKIEKLKEADLAPVIAINNGKKSKEQK